MTNSILPLLAAILNIGTVYFAKASEGMTRLWPILGVVTTILLTQFGRAGDVGGRSGGRGDRDGGGRCHGRVRRLIGYFAFAERLSALQVTGYAIAVLGVIVASLAPAAA